MKNPGNPDSSPNAPKGNAFTLVELLVVIVIVAVLAPVTLSPSPSVSRPAGNEQAHRASGQPELPPFRKQLPNWRAKGNGGTIRPYILNQDQRINGTRVFDPQSPTDPESGTMQYPSFIQCTGANHLGQLPLISDGSTAVSQPHAHGNVRNILLMESHAESKPLDYPINRLK